MAIYSQIVMYHVTFCCDNSASIKKNDTMTDTINKFIIVLLVYKNIRSKLIIKLLLGKLNEIPTQLRYVKISKPTLVTRVL